MGTVAEQPEAVSAFVAETVADLLDRAADRLTAAGVAHPRKDALLLAAHVMGQPCWWILAHREAPVPRRAETAWKALLKRRAGRFPLSYLLGTHEFWGLPLRIGPGALIPRPETEHLVEASLAAVTGIERPVIVEAGVGSGCILKALASERQDARLVGIELSPEALAWARRNLEGSENVLLCQGDFMQPPPFRQADLCVSNPPYVTDEEWADLAPEIRCHEPGEALRCGSDALAPYRSLACWA